MYGICGWLVGLAVTLSVTLPGPDMLGGEAGFEAHIAALKAAADARPDDPEVALRLAQGLGAHGRYDEALTWLKAAGERGAHPLRRELVAGDVHLAAERYEFALRSYFEVASAAPENGYAHLRMWRVLREADILPPNVDKARLETYLRDAGYHVPGRRLRPPRTPMARQLAERAYDALRQGQFTEALEGFTAALSNDDGHPPAYRGMGIAYARMGKAAQARAAYRIYLFLVDRETRETREVRRLLSDAARRRGLAAERGR